MSAALSGAVAAALMLCSLTAGFLFAFAVVVMPGITKLDDEAYLRAFQVMDGIIQDNSPLFIVMWAGSVVAMLAVLVLGVGAEGLSGSARALLVGAALLYLGGVQLPTAVVNIPLNNRVQGLHLDQLDASTAERERGMFEARWNRWNIVRTVVAIVAVLMLVTAVATSAVSGRAPTRPDDTEVARIDGCIRQATGVEIGSISKQFMAAAILLLIEDGHLKLGDPIRDYLSELPGEWRGVPIQAHPPGRAYRRPYAG